MVTHTAFWTAFAIGFVTGGLTSPIIMLLVAALLPRLVSCKRCGERKAECFCLGRPR